VDLVSPGGAQGCKRAESNEREVRVAWYGTRDGVRTDTIVIHEIAALRTAPPLAISSLSIFAPIFAL